MKILSVLFCAILLAGCSGVHKKGISRYDDYDAVKVDQMVGNNVSGAAFQKTLVCLNARRESRRVTAITNTIVTPVTNATVNAITNQTISVATNLLFTTMTNLAPPLPGVPAAGHTAEEVAATTAAAETNTVVTVTNPGPAITTNVTVSLAANQSATTAPNQTAANNQFVRTFNNQITTASNQLTVSLMTNLVVTAETNQVVSYATNYAVSSVTNTTITPTNFQAHDYFLYTELTPPPDFTLQTGESLVLLVDGVRYGYSQTPSTTAFVGRRGFTSGLYRVPPEVLVAIANAKEVRIRFKGVNTTVERTMNEGSKRNFKAFLVHYFAPEPNSEEAANKMAASDAQSDVATR
jgi:hypothetical protein